MRGTEGDEAVPFDWDALVASVLHPTRVAIIEAMTWIGEPLSATDIKKIFGGKFLAQTIGYHLTALEKVGGLVKVRQRHVRGATESFYFPPGASASLQQELTAPSETLASVGPSGPGSNQ